MVNNLYNMQYKISILTVVLFALLFSGPVFAQQVDPNTGNTNFNISEEMDAIAVRVLPNPNHYNAIRWYKSQGFQGSPQSLMVDGYDAVRDGRSVYVNASNVDLVNQTIYTNIYLISYNQSSNFKTVDVLGQLIKNWRFNSNLKVAGQCTTSTLLCQEKSDCSTGYDCVGAGEGPGRCIPEEQQSCFIDNDCAAGVYCDSLRAKVNRDVRRLGVLGDLRESIAAFRQKNNHYPILSAGTYVANRSVSTWPSWKTSLLSQIAAIQTSVDPINTLGVCHGYDPVTCWNESTKSFADPDLSNNEFELPLASYAFVYSGDENGSNYNLCAGMETKVLGFNTAEGQLADSGCISSGSAYTGSIENKAPYLMETNLQGRQNQVFNGSIRVYDPENNQLSWSISSAQPNWTGWSAVPILQDTNNPNQKRVYAQKAGTPGIYNLSLNVTDGYGGTLSTITPITIINDAPSIQSQDISYYPSTVIPLVINFSINDADHPVNYTRPLVKAQYNSGEYDLLSSAHSQFIGETSNRVGDTVNYTLKYNILTTNNFSQDQNFVYNINARDAYTNTSTKQINIKIKADPPALDFNCSKNVRVGTDYYCGLGWGKQGDHTVRYSAPGGLPAGLFISEATNIYEPALPDDGSVTSKNNLLHKLKNILVRFTNSKANAAATPKPYYAIVGKPQVAAQGVMIKVRAQNEFAAFSEQEFKLNINTFCGDGLLQKPNTEGKGGLYNDGQESCDGLNGTTRSATSSRPDLQYCCQTTGQTSFPIRTNNQCTYIYSALAGGYCGDNLCAGNFENSINCPGDCGPSNGSTPPPLSLTCATPNNPGGNDPQIVCEPFTYGGQLYNTVVLGGRCWMAQNLNIGTLIYVGEHSGGDPVINDSNRAPGITKYCYGDEIQKCRSYGALYTSTMAKIDGSLANQGICPDGWHIPSDAEWYQLESTVSATTNCDPARASYGCIPSGAVLKNGGFHAILSGYLHHLGGWVGSGAVRYWGADVYSGSDNQNKYNFRGINRFDAVQRSITGDGADAYAVRCIKN